MNDQQDEPRGADSTAEGHAAARPPVEDGSPAQSGAHEDAAAKIEPTFLALLAVNLRVVGVSLLVILLAYAIWRGLAGMFPDVSWLQM